MFYGFIGTEYQTSNEWEKDWACVVRRLFSRWEEYSYLEVGVALVVVVALAAPEAFAWQEDWDLKYMKSKCQQM